MDRYSGSLWTVVLSQSTVVSSTNEMLGQPDKMLGVTLITPATDYHPIHAGMIQNLSPRAMSELALLFWYQYPLFDSLDLAVLKYLYAEKILQWGIERARYVT